MKKLFALLAVAATFASCSDDDSPAQQEEPFFNLAEGNLWVYKRYYSDGSDPAEFVDRIDSVRVVGQQMINGESYFNLHHKIYQDISLNEERDEFLRVDQNGHLVNSQGIVVHPGTDANYQYTHVDEFGTINYSLAGQATEDIEGEMYAVYPYVGLFTPADANQTAGLGVKTSYSAGKGVALYHCRYVASTAYYQDRLAYYDVQK